MINRDATIRWKGYDPCNLSVKSNKKVWANCDICGRGRWVKKSQYRELCHDCSIHTPEYIENHNIVNNSDYIKEMRSNNAKDQWSNPDSRDKLLTGINKAWKDESRRDTLVERQSGEKSCWFGVFGDKHGRWDGGRGRSYVLPINECVKLNKKFVNSDAHHITPSIVIYIPEKLHQHYSHCIGTGRNMDIVNMAALQYLNGYYNG